MPKRLQYDSDIASEQAELYLHVYDLLKANESLHVLYKEYVTSFHSDEGGVCYLRIKNGELIVGFFKGAYLSEYEDVLTGTGKTMRHLTFTCKDEINEALLQEIVEESIIYNIEQAELKKMRCR